MHNVQYNSVATQSLSFLFWYIVYWRFFPSIYVSVEIYGKINVYGICQSFFYSLFNVFWLYEWHRLHSKEHLEIVYTNSNNKKGTFCCCRKLSISASNNLVFASFTIKEARTLSLVFSASIFNLSSRNFAIFSFSRRFSSINLICSSSSYLCFIWATSPLSACFRDCSKKYSLK